ncbi:hypothetical protein BTVI_71460 [Pitangus sulphuratus]|nr:hypothetical protein BTVI_71460 [Pitangus sulphuratus]
MQRQRLSSTSDPGEFSMPWAQQLAQAALLEEAELAQGTAGTRAARYQQPLSSAPGQAEKSILIKIVSFLFYVCKGKREVK